MAQNLIIILLFVTAVVYLGRQAWRSFRSGTCASGCGKCNAVDFAKLERKIKEKQSALG